MPAPHHSKVFYRPDALPAAQPTASIALKAIIYRLYMVVRVTLKYNEPEAENVAQGCSQVRQMILAKTI